MCSKNSELREVEASETASWDCEELAHESQNSGFKADSVK
jgi:hypothetical protein